MIPVRCFTCGKVLGDKENKCKFLLQEGKKWNEILDTLKLKRYCCRMVLMTYSQTT